MSTVRIIFVMLLIALVAISANVVAQETKEVAPSKNTQVKKKTETKKDKEAKEDLQKQEARNKADAEARTKSEAELASALYRVKQSQVKVNKTSLRPYEYAEKNGISLKNADTDRRNIEENISSLRKAMADYCYKLSKRLAEKKVADQVLWEAEDLASCKEEEK